MKHSFGLDVLGCPKCKARLRLVAVIFDRAELRRRLQHLCLFSDPRARGTAGPASWAPRPSMSAEAPAQRPCTLSSLERHFGSCPHQPWDLLSESTHPALHARRSQRLGLATTIFAGVGRSALGELEPPWCDACAHVIHDVHVPQELEEGEVHGLDEAWWKSLRLEVWDLDVHRRITHAVAPWAVAAYAVCECAFQGCAPRAAGSAGWQRRRPTTRSGIPAWCAPRAATTGGRRSSECFPRRIARSPRRSPHGMRRAQGDQRSAWGRTRWPIPWPRRLRRSGASRSSSTPRPGRARGLRARGLRARDRRAAPLARLAQPDGGGDGGHAEARAQLRGPDLVVRGRLRARPPRRTTPSRPRG
jgi:hypothetical protein